MWTWLKEKIKAAWKAAAALIVAGATVAVGLFTALQDEGVQCKDWRRVVDRLNDPSKHYTFFVAVKDGTTIPKAYADEILGDCSGGICSYDPHSCAEPIEYTYDCGPLVAGWRVCELRGHPRLIRGWKVVAETETYFRWYRSLGQVVTDCLAHFTGVQCIALLDAPNKCWKLATGDRWCVKGKMYGPLLGGNLACAYGDIAGRMDCDATRQAGSEWVDAERVFVDADFDEF